MKKVLKSVSTLCIIGGIVFLFGTAGASDNEAIGLSQVVTQSIASLGIIYLGYGIRKIVL